MGIWVGAPFGVGYYIWKSLIPTLLGNIVGGGLFVGTSYWYLYLTGDVAVEINFNIGGLNSAMEAGGPMRASEAERMRSSQLNGGSSTLFGREPSGGGVSTPVEGQMQKNGGLSSAGNNGHVMSAFGKDFSDDSPYAKTHAERMANETSDEEKA